MLLFVVTGQSANNPGSLDTLLGNLTCAEAPKVVVGVVCVSLCVCFVVVILRMKKVVGDLFPL